MSKILITGGAGFIGAHATQALVSKGHDVIIFDNLSNGFKEQTLGQKLIVGDIRNFNDLNDAFKQHKDIDGVFHFAGLIEAGRSVTEPDLFHDVNVNGTKNLLKVMEAHAVKKLVFSSTAAVYGSPITDIIDEDHPLNPINPYGETKKICEELIHDAHNAWGLEPAILRYFNAAGCDPQGRIGERHDPETHLIPLVIDAVLGKRSSLEIFGTDYDTPDGTCVRDYVHVCDLADAHVKAFDRLDTMSEPLICNLGTGRGFSVQEVIETANKILPTPVAYNETRRREGDPAILVCSIGKAKKMINWTPKYPLLTDMIQHCYAFRKNF